MANRKQANQSKVNQTRAARRQMFLLLKKHGIKRSVGLKDMHYVKIFCEMYNLNCPSKTGKNKFLFDLYTDENFVHIKRNGNEPRSYEGYKWKVLRKKVLLIYGKKYMKCGSENNIHVDHIKPYSIYPELSLDFDNLQVLCGSCNSSKSNKKEIDYRPLMAQT